MTNFCKNVRILINMSYLQKQNRKLAVRSPRSRRCVYRDKPECFQLNKRLLFKEASTSPGKLDRPPIKSYKWIVGAVIGASTSVALVIILVLVFGVFKLHENGVCYWSLEFSLNSC